MARLRRRDAKRHRFRKGRCRRRHPALLSIVVVLLPEWVCASLLCWYCENVSTLEAGASLQFQYGRAACCPTTLSQALKQYCNTKSQRGGRVGLPHAQRRSTIHQSRTCMCQFVVKRVKSLESCPPGSIPARQGEKRGGARLLPPRPLYAPTRQRRTSTSMREVFGSQIKRCLASPA